MNHLWSPAASRASGLSVAYCGVRIDRLPEGDVIRESGMVDCPSCAKPGDYSGPPGRRAQRIAFLERMRETTKADLLAKFENGDWHGTADAAMDLRDIDSELEGLRYE